MIEGGTVQRRCVRRETAEIYASSEDRLGMLHRNERPHKLGWLSVNHLLQQFRLNCSVSTGSPTTLILCHTTASLAPSISVRLSSVKCSTPTPFASKAFDFLRFSEMPSTPRRSCSHSVTFASTEGPDCSLAILFAQTQPLPVLLHLIQT